jgi:hypothetical protein
MMFVIFLFFPISLIIVGYGVWEVEIMPDSRRMGQVSRREFMGAAGKGLLGAGLLGFSPDLFGRTVSAHPALQETLPLVSVSAGTNDDTPEAILKTALEGLGGIQRFVKPGMTVAIKPNATWAYPPHTASSTDPEMLVALIHLVREAGAGRIIVMDHCSIEPGAADSLRVSGIGKLVKEEGVEGIFPDRNNAPLKMYTKIDLPQGEAFQQLGVIKAATEADLRINLAVAKTHNVTKMTMCMKHMMGFLQSPGLLHARLERGIVDLSTPSTIQASLHILEALRVRMPYESYRACAGPETDVTNPNVVRRWNQIVVGTDPALIDAYGTVTYFGMQPEELPYLAKAAEVSFGTTDVQGASQDGRLKIFSAGKPIAVATPTAVSPTQNTEASRPAVDLTTPGPTPAGPASTSTPLPTATALPADLKERPVGIAANSGEPNSQVVDLKPFLSVGLIPVAMVVTGVGLVAAARIQHRNPPKPPAGKEDGDEQG